jgi:hypothetical protein
MTMELPEARAEGSLRHKQFGDCESMLTLPTLLVPKQSFGMHNRKLCFLYSVLSWTMSERACYLVLEAELLEACTEAELRYKQFGDCESMLNPPRYSFRSSCFGTHNRKLCFLYSVLWEMMSVTLRVLEAELLEACTEAELRYK